MSLLKQLWNDETGAVLSAELIMVTSILVAGLASGLSQIRNSMLSEMSNVSNMISSVNQSYTYAGAHGSASSTAGSYYIDQTAQNQYCTNVITGN